MSEAIIELSRGYRTVIETADLPLVSPYKWYYATRGNAEGYIIDRIVKLHRFIMAAPEGTEIDHIDCDPLNNRRANLRFASRQQQSWNTRRRCDNKSGYKGVVFFKPHRKWVARITVNKKQTHLGYFTEVTDAARAYDAAARLHFGPFARLNFPAPA